MKLRSKIEKIEIKLYQNKIKWIRNCRKVAQNDTQLKDTNITPIVTIQRKNKLLLNILKRNHRRHESMDQKFDV